MEYGKKDSNTAVAASSKKSRPKIPRQDSFLQEKPAAEPISNSGNKLSAAKAKTDEKKAQMQVNFSVNAPMDLKIQEEKNTYPGIFLDEARAKYPRMDDAAKFVEKLFGEPFHAVKVNLVGQMYKELGNATTDGKKITLLNGLPIYENANPEIHELVHAKDFWHGGSVMQQKQAYGIGKGLFNYITEGRATYGEYIFQKRISSYFQDAEKMMSGAVETAMLGISTTALLLVVRFLVGVQVPSALMWGVPVCLVGLPYLFFEYVKSDQEKHGNYYYFSNKLFEMGKMLGNTQEDHMEVFKMSTKKIPRTWNDMNNPKEFYKEELAEIQRKKSQNPAS